MSNLQYFISKSLIQNNYSNEESSYIIAKFITKLAEIKNDIEKLPLGFDTQLDENAKILSGGQKQRLTIARALLSPAKVLIFDEATSGLDTITEKKVVDNLISLKDKTVIFIAHRLAIAERTDNIVVLNQGRIIEQGNHTELMAKHGYYYDLVKS